jgi:hypothetical protein
MKHRRNSKIKREHDLIADLDDYLQTIESITEVQLIVPGIITMRRGVGSFKFSVQRTTETGLRCIAKNQGAVQEVFITTNEPMIVWQRIEGDI